MSATRPLFLVVSTAGLTAALADGRVVAVLPGRLPGIGNDPAEHLDPALMQVVDPTGVILVDRPIPLVVLDSGVHAWSPVLGRRIRLGRDQLDVLSFPNEGIPIESDWGQRLIPLVGAGVLETGRTSDRRSSGGYLRTTAGSTVPDRPEPLDQSPGSGIPVHLVCASHIAAAPLGLGMLAAAVTTHDDGRLLDVFDLRPIRRETESTAREVASTGRSGVLMCSNYMWSVSENLALCKEVKALTPRSVTVHGGPSTPKYDGDIDAFFGAHAYVDILVLGEGEVTVVEVLDRLADRMSPDDVAGVPGTVVRRSDGSIHRGPPRERVADLSTLASPYLLGLFDHLDGGLLDLMTVETNRGCPYCCTFCDWGSATMSRIRQFPIQRVLEELRWVAQRRTGTVFIADANFGVLPRDLQIAQHIVDLRRSLGSPETVLVSFAKNQTHRAVDIVRTWIDGGVVTEGSIALQSSDEATLDAVHRRNIKVEQYDELTAEFRRLGLPLAVDLMLGLPGSTVASFRSDLQRCVDGELTARVYPTVVLPNSPMNEPAYREKHRIQTDHNDVVVSCSSFDDDDYRAMLRLRRLHRAGDHFGVFRYVARWTQADHSVPALDLYSLIDDRVESEPERWPSLVWVAQHLPRWTVPPPGWPPMLSELRELLLQHLGLPDDSAMATALLVQLTHLPEPGALFPRTTGLAHDYVAWSRSLDDGDRQPLISFEPGSVTVSDPRGICAGGSPAHFRHHSHPDVDSVMSNEFWIADDWELSSPLSRRTPQVLADELRERSRPLEGSPS